MNGYLAYLWLEAKRQWRDRQALLFRLGLPTGVYLILIAVQDRPDRPSGSPPWETGRMVALAALGAVISGLAAGPSLGEERTSGWLRQLRVATAPITTLGALLGLTFAAQAAQGATNLAFLVLWLLGGIFTSPDSLPDTLAAVSRSLPSYGAIQVGQAAAGGSLIPASAVAVLAAWTAGAGALGALAWRRVVVR